jgi:hypothetical protein
MEILLDTLTSDTTNFRSGTIFFQTIIFLIKLLLLMVSENIFHIEKQFSNENEGLGIGI